MFSFRYTSNLQYSYGLEEIIIFIMEKMRSVFAGRAFLLMNGKNKDPSEEDAYRRVKLLHISTT